MLQGLSISLSVQKLTNDLTDLCEVKKLSIKLRSLLSVHPVPPNLHRFKLCNDIIMTSSLHNQTYKCHVLFIR